MKSYRIYAINLDDLIEGPPKIVIVADDCAALAVALASNISGGGCEVWHDSRKVGRLSPWIERKACQWWEEVVPRMH